MDSSVRNLAGVERIELPFLVLETSVLPLNDTPIYSICNRNISRRINLLYFTMMIRKELINRHLRTSVVVNPVSDKPIFFIRFRSSVNKTLT